MTSPLMETMIGSTVRERMWADRVRMGKFRDQHGRQYSTMVDKETGDPAAPLTPVDFRAPFPSLYAPAKYQTFPPDQMGVMLIDYDRWIVDTSDAWRSYEQELMFWARKEFAGGAMRAIEEGNPKLRELAGPPPASVEFIKAMKSGNKWALGIARPDGTRYPMPPWAVELVDTLRVYETYEGTGVSIQVDPNAYPDVEDDDAYAVADRYAAAAQYDDVEEDADPSALPDFQPIKRGRGRPPKGA
jgi:hypothetical protein